MVDLKRGADRQSSGNKPVTEQVAAVPLLEERLEVTRRQVETGRVRVHVDVEERQEILTEELLRDDLQIERVPRNIPIDEVPHVRLEGNTTIVPVVEEVVVVQKTLVLVEEIHICRKSTSETREIPVTLRSERARVERADAADTPSDQE